MRVARWPGLSCLTDCLSADAVKDTTAAATTGDDNDDDDDDNTGSGA